MNIPNHLTALAADINAALTREETNRADWVEIKLDLCRLFAEARNTFKDDIGFGKWFAKEIGNTINEQDRAAYVAMGADLARTRTVLEKTTRSSIQHIYKNEFPDRSAHVSKPASPLKPKTPAAEVRDSDIIGRWDRGEAVADIGAATGLGQRRVDRIIQDEKIRREGKAEGALEEAPLSASAQAKLDAHKRKLEKEFDWVVRQKVIAEVDAAYEGMKKTWKDNLGKLETALNRRGKVFSKAEYSVLLQVAHPDTGAHVSDEKRAEAFRLLNERKVRLLDEEAFPTVAPRAPVARTIEELFAARAKVKAENSERARKAAATRKAKQQETQP
jgi:hypothetical protein